MGPSCLGITKPYMPDGVSQQFEHIQGILGQVILPERAFRPVDPTRYNVTYPRVEWVWARRHNTHTIGLEQMGPPAISPFHIQPNYLMWYYQRTHLMLCHPEHEIPREHPRPGPCGDYIAIERINRVILIMHHQVEPRREDHLIAY